MINLTRMMILSAGLLFAATFYGPANAVTADDVICNKCVGTGDIANRAIKRKKIHPTARPGAAFAGGDGGPIAVSSSPEVLRAVTINIPAAGIVIVNASAYFEFNNQLGIVRCSISKSAATTSVLSIISHTANDLQSPIGMTQAFNESKGSHTYNLVCTENGGGSNATKARDPQINALWVPEILGDTITTGVSKSKSKSKSR